MQLSGTQGDATLKLRSEKSFTPGTFLWLNKSATWPITQMMIIFFINWFEMGGNKQLHVKQVLKVCPPDLS